MKKSILLFLLVIVVTSCKKLVDVGSPQNQLTTDKVFSDTSSALAALGNIYAQLDKTLEVNYSKYLDLYTDNLAYTGSTPQVLEFYQSTVSTDNSTNLIIWQNLYLMIYECNDLIAQLPVSGKIPQSSISELSNEARFLRAFAYFYLVNLYGDVPLLLTTNVNINAGAKRTETVLIYQQMVTDLIAAQSALPITYQGLGKVRANKWAAAALLARVYLFQQNWTAAETTASSVINSGLYTPLDPPASVFLAGSQEAILQVWNQYGFVTSAADLIPASNSVPIYPVSSSLYNSFEPGDLRAANWIGSSSVIAGNTNTNYYYPYKYKNRDANNTSAEYLMVLRASEQYLIRAEARAEQNKLTGAGSAAEDLNVIRSRAGLPNTSASTQADIVAAIMKERRVELFDEWGHRFLDLKRTGALNAVMQVYKTNWIATDALLPVPLNELTYDPNLTQNPGY